MNDNIVIFKVDGRPKAKARPRVTKHGTYTPKSTINYENAVALAYKAAKGKCFDEPVMVDITACFRLPKNMSKKDRQMYEAKPYPCVPDLDNIAKSICDGLNKVAYTDDRLITTLQIRKVYAATDSVVVIVSRDRRSKE